ncbi:MAG: DUF1641 domain-containing protein [Ectobacillus sp.]
MANVSDATNKPIEQMLDELGQQERVEAMLYLIQKLPEMKSAVQSAENFIMFAQSVLADKRSWEPILEEAKEYFEDIPFKLESIRALLLLLNKAPKLLEWVETAETFIDFAQSILQDKQSLTQVTEQIEEKAAPVLENAKRTAEIMKETKALADARQPTNVSIFRLLRLLKDPTVRKMVVYLEAFLEIMNHKHN